MKRAKGSWDGRNYQIDLRLLWGSWWMIMIMTMLKMMKNMVQKGWRWFCWWTCCCCWWWCRWWCCCCCCWWWWWWWWWKQWWPWPSRSCCCCCCCCCCCTFVPMTSYSNMSCSEPVRRWRSFGLTVWLPAGLTAGSWGRITNQNDVASWQFWMWNSWFFIGSSNAHKLQWCKYDVTLCLRILVLQQFDIFKQLLWW